VLRRYAPMRKSIGTRWPPEVRAHVSAHQTTCLGTIAGMPGRCEGGLELDHIRASGGIGMKSDSIATNAARLCGAHHRLKTREGRTWRPHLLDALAILIRGCAECEAEHLEHYGPLADDCGHVDPVWGCPGPCQRVSA
jgi:hypothetical protein